jgi:type IV pilus assembly protein PilW
MSKLLRSRRSRKPAVRGFSLVELMVGVLIGMIGIVVIFQVLQVSESRKRTTASGSDAQITGTVALFSLERDLKLAGFGFGAAAGNSGGNLMGCDVIVYDNQNPAVNFNVKLSPVLITDGPGGAPDTITVLWGNAVKQSFFQTFVIPSTNTTKVMQFRDGLDKGDLAIVGANQATVGGISTAGQFCHLLEITGHDNPDNKTLDHAPGTYLAEDGVQNKITRYDNPAGWSINFTAGGFLFNMGPYPRANQWSLRNGKLGVVDLLHYLDTNGDGQNDWVEVAGGIVDLQAEYGYDADNNGVVDDTEWTSTLPVNPVWSRVRAVRIAVLGRSNEYEKDYTAPNPTWGSSAAGACAPKQCFVMNNIDGSPGTAVPADPTLDWRRYRYRVYETIVPFRNVMWGGSA